MAGDGVDADTLVNRDWNDFNQNTATDEDLAAIETAVAEYFSRHTMHELYDIAVETNLMLAPANSPARSTSRPSSRHATSSGPSVTSNGSPSRS